MNNKISKPVTKCNNNKYVNPDYYSVVVVQTLQERDSIPCKLRQDGMLVVVVEEGPYNKYQIRSSELGLSACDNNSFIKVVEGSGGDEEPEKDSLQSVMERGNTTTVDLLLQSKLTITPSELVDNDPTYNKNIVAKPDGTFGWEDKKEIVDVSRTQSGIVNNTLLQELGGVDKLINGHRVGRGKNNDENSVAFGLSSLSNSTTSIYNVAIGAYSLEALKTGSNNSAIGLSSLVYLTTGNFNTAIGESSGFLITTGYRNTLIGRSVMNRGNGSLNTVIGQGAAGGSTANYGDRNTILGTVAGSNGSGTNNILIGVGAGNGENLTNKLIIHSNTSLVNYSNTSEGVYSSPNQSRLSQALITGDFAELWVKLNGTLSVAPSKLVNNDPTYTKNLVAKVDGTFGWEDKVNTSNIYSTTETKTNGIWIDGKVIYRKFVTITIAANAITDNPFSNVIAGASEIISFEKCFMKIDTGTIKFAPGRLESNTTFWEYDIRNNNDLSIIMRVASALPRVISGVVEYTKPAN